ALPQGPAAPGYVEGRNVAIEFRWAHNDTARLPELAADLVRNRVAVIATPGAVVSALTAKAATTTIPIVFNTGSDPVEVGLGACGDGAPGQRTDHTNPDRFHHRIGPGGSRSRREPQQARRQHHRRQLHEHGARGPAARGAGRADAEGRG